MNEAEVKGRAAGTELEWQRNFFALRCVELQAELAVVNARNGELNAQVAELTKAKE